MRHGRLSEMQSPSNASSHSTIAIATRLSNLGMKTEQTCGQGHCEQDTTRPEVKSSDSHRTSCSMNSLRTSVYVVTRNVSSGRKKQETKAKKVGKVCLASKKSSTRPFGIRHCCVDVPSLTDSVWFLIHVVWYILLRPTNDGN